MTGRYRLFALFVQCLLFAGSSAFASGPGGPGPKRGSAPPPFYLAPDSVATVIPFNRVGNLILVQARADSIEGNFIFDTGAQTVLLNSTYFRDYPATTVSDMEQAGINGSHGSLSRITLGKLGLGSLSYKRQEADLGELGHIENSKGVKILGLLGMELFRDCEIMLDYEENLLYISRVKRREPILYTAAALLAAPGYTELSFDIKENYILVRTEIAGKKYQFVMDSGAETSVLDSRLPNEVFAGVEIARRVQVAGSTKKKEAFFGTLALISVGGEKLKAVPVLVSNLEKSCFGQYDCVNGILSFDAFQARKIGFNFVTRKLYIWR
jgi:hypothetical protein